MTPQSQMGNAGMSGGAPSNLYQNMSSQGQPPDNSQQQSTDDSSGENQTQTSPAEQFIQRLGAAFTPFQSLLESYPQASQQAEDVKKAISNWISAINGQLSQQGGGESQSPL